MGIKLSELRIEGRANAISHSVFSRASAADCNHLLNVFANLRKISVNVNTHQDRYPLNFDGLGRLLTHAAMAQSLDLECTRGQRLSCLRLSRVFQGFEWSHLKHFGLHRFRMTTDVELIAFFDRHRATLDSVSLRNIFLHERDIYSTNVSPCEAWKNFFGELRRRSIKFKSLNLEQIHDCYNFPGGYSDLAAGTNYGERVLHYLHEGGSNPLTSVAGIQARVG